MQSEIEELVREEEALLVRARAALAAARARKRASSGEGMRSAEELRALREDARTASADDLPAILHEMSVRASLRARTEESALPDADAPYIAHLRVRDERGVRDYLLGHGTFIDPRSDVRIVDVRTAPIANVFYRHREGDDYDEEIADAVISGVVLARRIVVVEGGALRRILAPGLSLERGADGGWTEEAASALAAGGAGHAARAGALGVGAGEADRATRADVTALLDPAQHAAIALPPERPLVVLGSAGSGKTTVALHRLARLTAREPSRVPLERCRVVVPEEGLARLARRLLAPLGAGEAQVRTLDDWAVALGRRAFGALPRFSDDTPAVVVRLKRHPALYDALGEELAALPRRRALSARALRRLLGELFSDRAFLGRVVERADGDLPRAAVEETVRHTMNQLRTPVSVELEDIVDPVAKETIDGLSVWERTPDATAGTIDVEDLPIWLWARGRAAGWEPADTAHLVLDEAEDFALFDLEVLGHSLEAKSITLAGDESQRTASCFAGWDRAQAALGVRDAEVVRLEVSYRCPRPIVEIAQAILGEDAPKPAAAREGAPVARLSLPTEAQAHIAIATAIVELVDREPRASIALIARDAAAAARLHRAVADLPSARLVVGGSFSFEPGVDVTHVDAVKGLEFDYVVVPDADAESYPDTPESRRRLHVAVTRASFQLWLVSGGPPSAILESTAALAAR